MEFEKIDACRARARIFGGWIVETIVLGNDSKKVIAITSCFVPDIAHEWQIIPSDSTEKYCKNDTMIQ